MRPRIVMLLALVSTTLGCSDPATQPSDGATDVGADGSLPETDGGDPQDGGDPVDSGDAVDGGDAGRASGGLVIGGFSSGGGTVQSGSRSIVLGGFEWSEPACVGARCVVGSWVVSTP